MDRAIKQSTHPSISQNIFSYLKMFSMQCRKNITVEDSKKEMNKANFTNMYMQIYIPMLYVMRMTQNKKDSLNSILLHGHVVDNNCGVVFLILQGFHV